MTEEHTTPHSTIRTFARDLATAREKRGQVPPDDSSADAQNPDNKTPVEPKENFKAQAPQQTTQTEPKIVAPEKKPIEKKLTPEAEPVKKTPEHIQTKIPAFHELKNKASEEIQKLSESEQKKNQPKPILPKISVHKKSKKPARANIGYDAAIITDNKESHFNLFSAISSSLKAWVKAFSVSKKKKSPVYTVPDTQRRKGVIQKATSKSGSIFTADSAELRAKIRQRQKRAESAMQAKIAQEGELSWSPYTDTGFHLLESPEEPAEIANPHNVAVEFKKQALHSSPSTASKPLMPPVPSAPHVEAALEAPAKQDVDSQSIDSRWETVPVEKEISSVTAVAPVPEPVTKIESAPASPLVSVNLPDEGVSSESPKSNLQTLNTNTLAISIVAGLSCVVVLFFVGKVVFEYFTTVEAVVSTDTTSYLPSATPNPVVVAQTNSITDIPLQAGTLLDIDYVDTQLFMPTGAAVSPSTIISALEFNVLPSFSQSLSEIRFAQINNSAPVIVFQFTDTDTTLGGFLAWEDSMAQDLRELYLITQTNDMVFTDKILGGKDVRALVSANGEVLTVYGIVSDDTAIITKSLETFTQVLNASFDG